jgi:hypothetical protein
MRVNFDQFMKTFGKKSSEEKLKSRQEKVREAFKELKDAIETLTAIGASPEPYKTTLLGLAVQFSNVIKRKDPGDEIFTDLDEIREEARTAAKQAREAALNSEQAKVPEKQLFLQVKYLDKKPGELRAFVEEELQKDSGFVKKLADGPGGVEILDMLVDSLKGKAESPISKELVKKAMVLRFKMTDLTGTLNAKSLPHLYKVLKMVPESHGRNNPMLDKIDLKVGDGSADYTGGRIELRCMFDDRDSFWAKQFEHDPEDGVPKKWLAKGDDHHQFDETTLHEIGHSVDDKLKFMEQRVGNDDFGGWEKTSALKIAKQIGEKSGFFADWPNYSKNSLTLLLSRSFAGQPNRLSWTEAAEKSRVLPSRQELLDDVNIRTAEEQRISDAQGDVPFEKRGNWRSLKGAFQDNFKNLIGRDVIELILKYGGGMPIGEAVDQVRESLAGIEDPPGEEEWKKMLKDPVFAWCKQTGKTKSWDLGAAHAKEVAKYDGNVYTNAKEGWFKYTFAARKKSISKYQFNTPAEWFSELYAAYYLKKLPPAHPDYKWMTDEVHNLK